MAQSQQTDPPDSEEEEEGEDGLAEGQDEEGWGKVPEVPPIQLKSEEKPDPS
jgi:hypothetical protein